MPHFPQLLRVTKRSDMPPKQMQTPRLLVGLTVLASPASAYASDFTGLMLLLVGALAGMFVVVFALTWFATRLIAQRWLRLLIRVAVICAFWTPVKFGGAGYWWPAAFAYGDPALAFAAVASAVGATVVVWLLAPAIFQPDVDANKT
jgi:hypothetical protein